jgi:hypothetical protein
LEPHTYLVGILFVVWGLLTVVVGASTLALGVAAASLMSAAGRSGSSQFAAGATAAIFTTLAVIAIVWGAAHIAVGFPLRKCAPRARMVALLLGSLDLVLLPYGTALGVYTLWVLLSERGKALYTPAVRYP